MHDCIMKGEKFGPEIGITNVAANQASAILKVGRKNSAFAVDLRAETVENCDLVTISQKAAGEMGSDESRTTGDEDLQSKVLL
jgi:hypothetical protein